MADMLPPHEYVPVGPVERDTYGSGYHPARVRREAFAAVLEGVPLGEYDRHILNWLTELDDPTCRSLASVMWRCRAAGLPAGMTEGNDRDEGDGPDGSA